ncbi:MAG: hypothetical protein JXJ04_21980 [Spirochaetales bacterium]|nr:hypothetical protein [Spirochaetales bacterium]
MNGKPLDVTLENEKNLGEIINGVEIWLKNSDLLITSIKISDKELLSEIPEKWKNTLIGDIDQVALTVKPTSEVHASSLQNIVHFITMLKQAFSNKDVNLLHELNDGYPFMIESLSLLTKQYKFKEVKNYTLFFANHFPSINPQKVIALTEKELHEAIIIIDTLLTHLIEMTEEINDPFNSLQKCGEKIKTSIQDISEVSILLQTGKDREAMNTLVSFSDTLQKFLRIFLILKENKNINVDSLTISDMSIEEYASELNGFLKELIDAFQINDSVLIGDLLEYEIAPRLEGLIRFIEKLSTLNTHV